MLSNRHPLRFSIILCGFLTLHLLSGCASIPKESVLLNQELGKAITQNQSAYLKLLNSHFSLKRKAIDDWIETTYTTTLMTNITTELRAVTPEKAIDSKMLADIVKTVVKKRDAMQEDLEKVRIALTERVNENTSQLLQMNASITGLLQSAVSVKESTAGLSQTLKKETGIDFDSLEKRFNDFLSKAGGAAGQATSFYDSIKDLLN